VGERSLWLVPVVFGLAGLGLAIGLVELDKSTRSFDALDFSSDTATQLLTATVGAAVAFTGFAFSVPLLVVRLASSQLSPRAMRVAYQSCSPGSRSASGSGPSPTLWCCPAHSG
jgi:uncharacterized membrane protein